MKQTSTMILKEPENMPIVSMTKADEKLYKQALKDYEEGKTISHKQLTKEALIKRLKKRSSEIDKYIANGGKLYTRKDLGL